MCDRKDVHIVFKDLPDGVCPQYFPLITEEVEGFSQEMLDKGIPANHWPHFPEVIRDNPEYPTANFLAKHLLILPVHQSLDQDYLERIVGKQVNRTTSYVS
jgi:dTDP-4-amino-4,6-dideoxygalactose transaminase